MTVKARDAGLWIPYIAVSVVHVVLLAVDNPLAWPTKIMLMPALAVPVIAAWRRIPSGPAVIMLVALVLSWIGDSAGAFTPDEHVLPVMLAFFGAAHVAYIVLFSRTLAARPTPAWALVYAAWWAVMVAIVGPHTEHLFIGVALYAIVLAGTAVMASRCTTVIAVGAAFFLTSDSFLGFQSFMPDSAAGWFPPVIMATYTIGQGLIVFGSLQALRPGDSSSGTVVG